MTTTTDPTLNSDREFVLRRRIHAPREKVFKAWIHPELLKKWFAPLPHTPSVAQLDVRLIFTDANPRAWEPTEKRFITVILTLDDENGGTRYTARVRHRTVADRKAHELMGFHQGWSQGADRLAALVEGP